jgi:hypothetical protein
VLHGHVPVPASAGLTLSLKASRLLVCPLPGPSLLDKALRAVCSTGSRLQLVC